MTSILMTPLRMKKIVPEDWTEWWHIWNTYNQPVSKQITNHNRGYGVFNGLDLYTDNTKKMIYSAPLAPKSKVVDNLVEQIADAIPIELSLVRVLENKYPVPFHSDTDKTMFELRSFLWNDYTEPVWSFKYYDETRQLIMPDDTNTFFYKDYPMKHSSIYDPARTKGLLAIYGSMKKDFFNFILDSSKYYHEHSWVV
jgi:hypothetical protein